MTEAKSAQAAGRTFSQAERRELLRRRLARREEPAPAPPPGAAHPTRAPLSYAQERLWLAHRMGTSMADYNVPMRWWLSGPVEAGTLRRALAAVTGRHDVLRTRYTGEEEPRQLVDAAMPFDWEHVDLRHLPADEAERSAAALSEAVVALPFDLETGPVLRARVYQVAEERWLLTVVVHHIAFDGWSAAILERELGTLYAAFAAGAGDPLPALGLQYADIAVEQRGDAGAKEIVDLTGYWCDRLAGLRRTDVPGDRPRPDEPTGAGAVHVFDVPARVVRDLEAVAKENDATLFMALLAAYHVLLGRYTGVTDVATGTPVANRASTAHEDLIGFFVDIIVLRSDLRSQADTRLTFAELLRRTRTTALEGYAHSGAPFQAVADAIGEPDRAVGAGPFFQSLFGLHSTPEHGLALPGVEVTEWPVPTTRAVYDLVLSLVPDGQALRGHLDYSTEVFDEATVSAFARHYLALLADLAAGPDRPLDECAPVDLAEHVPEGATVPHLGDAARGRRLYVLDERLRPVPRGAAGDLYLAGDEGDAEVLPDPHAATPALMARTGDRVRMGGDGTLHHLGRADGRIWRRGRLLHPDETTAAPPPVRTGPGDTAMPLLPLVAGVYADLLGVERVDPGQDLRAAGVDSLLTVRAAGRLRQALGRKVELRRLIKCRTVAELAVALGGVQPETGADARAAAATLDLSPAQRSIWFLERLRPGRTDYLLPVVWHLTGPLDAGRLRKALDDIVSRQEALRATFDERDGRPYQRITEPAPVPWSEADLSGLDPGQARAESRRLTAEEVTRPFDLTRGPLVRARLVRLEPERHTLIVTVHHIVFDGWSASILLSELDAAYRGLAPAAGEGPGYTGYAAERRRWLDGEEARELLAECTERLTGAPRLNLPPHAEPGQGAAGGRHTTTLPDELGKEVRELAIAENTSVFAVLLTVFSHLLGRLSGQDDVLVGVPFAGRDRPELERMIGLFLNTLVVRADLSGQASFRELLDRVSGAATDALVGRELPFELVVEALNPPRELDRNPLVDVLFNFGNTPPAAGRLGAAAVTDGEVESSDPKMWLTLYATPQGDGIRLDWVFRSDVLGARQVACMSAQFVHLLEQAVRGPDVLVGTYSMVTADQRAVLPRPQERLAPPREPSVFTQFEQAADRHGDAVAVIGRGVSMTYAELQDQVACVASMVSELTPPGAVVALSVPPSAELAAGMLGVLAAERPLVVIDPALPERRRRLMRRESGTRLVLRADHSGTGLTAEVVTPETEPPRLPTRPGDRVAYLSFTSGSTGMPKCVAGSERGLAQFVAWQRDTFGIGPGDRSAQLTALSFDVLYRDVLTPLVSGATLCVPDTGADDPDRLFAWLRDMRVTCLHTVPSVARAWLFATYADRSAPTLRHIFFAGEPLAGALVEEMRRRVADACYVNLYGPTETTLARLAHRLPPGPAPSAVPVGRPLPGGQALVLDRYGRLCAVGEPGEVVLRTPARSLGYVTASDADRRRFWASPFTGDPDDVLYRTGDRGRYRPDGLLELLGRLDDQLKVRGVRVEPGEIEFHLGRHPAVVNAAVAVLDGALVAFVEMREGDADARSLREFLAERLPESMVPAAYHHVGRIPTTASGKVDRSALARLRGTILGSAEHQEPRTPTESLIAGIWGQVLGAPAVGVHDNFFELGGDSLRLVHVVSLAKEQGLFLEVRDHYEHQTVARLSVVADARTVGAAREHQGPMVRLAAGRGDRPLSCVHPGGGSAAWYAALAHALPPGRAVLGFELPGAYGTGDPLTSIEDIAAEYVAALLCERPEGPHALLGWSLGGMIAFEMARQLRASGHVVDPLILIEPTLPADPVSQVNHQSAATMYRTAESLVGRATAAPEGSAARAALMVEVARYFEAIGWPPYEAELAGVLPLRACGLLHAAFPAYRPGPITGEAHLVLSREGEEASPASPSKVLHESADLYLKRWGALVPEIRVHRSGDNHMSMVGPANAAHLAGLCERLITPSHGGRT
ncbi:amino acid adenylation domain-containing protein [Nonomuraea angiospora]|uniref:amino acid adenylation domain-containing protein n=1 Tax=Nonomuraea angiospora TaxID=46172 RepID=UPI0033E68249